MTESAYDAYLSLRERWHGIVLLRGEADQDDKQSVYERLARIWGRMSMAERKCAGMHAKIVWHGAERA